MELSPGQDEAIEQKERPYLLSIANLLDVKVVPYRLKDSKYRGEIEDSIYDRLLEVQKGSITFKRPEAFTLVEAKTWDTDSVVDREVEKYLSFFLESLLNTDEEAITIPDNWSPDDIYAQLVNELKERVPVAVKPTRPVLPKKVEKGKFPLVPIKPVTPVIPRKDNVTDILRRMSAMIPRILDNVDEIASRLNIEKDQIHDFIQLFRRQ